MWGERRKAAAAAEQPLKGNGFDSSGCQYSIDEIERIVREGAPAGTNRSDIFHAIVGHYVGVGWNIDRIFEHLSEYSRGIGERYIAQDRLRREIERSAKKFEKKELPLFDNFEAKTPSAEVPLELKTPPQQDPEPEDVDDDDDLDADIEPQKNEHDPTLPRLHAHGDADASPVKSWLIKGLMPAVGHGLLSGQWGSGKTFAFFDWQLLCVRGSPGWATS